MRKLIVYAFKNLHENDKIQDINQPNELTSASENHRFYSKHKSRRDRLLGLDICDNSQNRDYSEISARMQNSWASALSYNWNEQKSWVDTPPNIIFNLPQKSQKVKYKMSLNKFLYRNGLFWSSEKKWSMVETQKLFRYYNEMGSDWKNIWKQLGNTRTINSIKCHFFNVLKWAADEYKYDFDRKLKKFESITFITPHNKLYQKSFFSSSQSQLISLIEVAYVLLGLGQSPNKSVKAHVKAFNKKISNQKQQSIWPFSPVSAKKSRIDEFYPTNYQKSHKQLEENENDFQLWYKPTFCISNTNSFTSLSMLKNSSTMRKVKNYKIKLYSEDESEAIIVPFEE